MLLDSSKQQTETNCAIVGQGFSIKASIRFYRYWSN